MILQSDVQRQPAELVLLIDRLGVVIEQLPYGGRLQHGALEPHVLKTGAAPTSFREAEHEVEAGFVLAVLFIEAQVPSSQPNGVTGAKHAFCDCVFDDEQSCAILNRLAWIAKFSLS